MKWLRPAFKNGYLKMSKRLSWCNNLEESTHELIPYRWTYKHEKNVVTSKKVESFVCQKCGNIIHMADIHEGNAKSLSDTSE